MAEFMANLRWLWIESGDKIATVMLVVAVAVLLIAVGRRATNEAD